MLTHAYSRARRWRVCLDECQMVREATTNLAKACRDLVSTHRWMISGTPLTTKIDDLNGELQFLRVWPFSLQVRRAARASCVAWRGRRLRCPRRVFRPSAVLNRSKLH